MDYILALITGPGTLRFVIQPALAILLGIRDGRNDAKAGKTPYLYVLLFEPRNRKSALGGGLRAIIIPFILAVAIDSALQFYIFGVWRLQWALVVGLGLVALPYVLSRAISNRVFVALG